MPTTPRSPPSPGPAPLLAGKVAPPIVAAAGVASAADTPLAIAVDGRPAAEIVVSGGCHSAELFAADDLAHWVEAITGARLPVVTNAPTAAPGAKIRIGAAFGSAAFPDDARRIGATDGFAIRRRGDDLYLFGTKPRASVYAVASLLEENTDLIWARPSEDFGTVFTQRPTLALDKTDILDIPAFEYHGWNVVAIRGDWPTAKWVIRNRGDMATLAEGKANAGRLGFRRSEGGHVYWWMAHPDKYFKTNPEFFSYSAIERRRVPETLCLTAPGLVDVAVSNLAARIAAMGGDAIDSFCISFRDSWACCQCPGCTAPIPLADGSELVCKSPDASADCKYYSTRYWLFVGEIARRLHAIFPSITFIGSGYMYTAEPPACDIPDFMHVDFCPIGGVGGAPLLSPEQSPTWRRRLEEWSSRFPGRVYFYEYWCSYDAGFARIRGVGRIRRKIARDLLDLRDVIKGKGIESELTPDSERVFSGHSMRSEWDAAIIDRWVLARLMWDPGQDERELERRFCERAYREAAPQMMRFYDLLASLTFDPATPPKQRSVFASKERAQAFAILEEALAAARHPVSRTLVSRLIAQWRVAEAASGAYTVPLMDKSEHFRDPGATCWETSLRLPSFRKPPYLTWTARLAPASETDVRFLTDGETLFARVAASTGSEPPAGDWISVMVVGRASGARSFTRVVRPGIVPAVRSADGYVAVLEFPLDALKIVFSARSTFPAYRIQRHDGASGELSTPGGEWPGKDMAVLDFLEGGQK